MGCTSNLNSGNPARLISSGIISQMTAKSLLVLSELARVFSDSDVEGEAHLIQELADANKIICVGAGRVGFAIAGFAKRLRHLGKDAYWYEDRTLPRMAAGDLMLVGSGSGETETVVCLAQIAQRQGLRLALVTSNPSSRLQRLSNVVVVLDAPNKAGKSGGVASEQPMTTLFEQACQIYLDALVLELMAKLDMSAFAMEENHNSIE